LVEVWLDEWKEFYYNINPGNELINADADRLSDDNAGATLIFLASLVFFGLTELICELSFLVNSRGTGSIVLNYKWSVNDL
jgi:hypothetical protein